MSDTEFDVVIAAHLIPDLAQKDFDALVKLVTGGCGAGHQRRGRQRHPQRDW